MLILLAEDDPKIGKLLTGLLKKDGYEVDHAVNGEEVLLYCEQNDYDVIVLDWMMPILDGIKTCEKLRLDGIATPILMLTAKDDLDDKVTGLETGADDYVVKPFEYRELLARLNALARRKARTLKKDSINLGQLVIERNSKTLRRNGEIIRLTKREYQLFAILVDNKNQTLPKKVLLDRIWGMDGEVTDNNLETLVRRLRKKIETSDEKLIKNVRGVGYKLEVENV
ncbi:response regulator transcription factor [Vallitalea pronyensis]|uniref:Stage 0 sporulation protein A homolog n=1 Tax=Vallitalea pronyensis TaxID=1348613 RepID=A0A8J8MGS0_9FIRM|nr:response regulator transcription factor [Vallitalea pronyensis]QUI21304.1 response regulator transcription factor [Vallitalea pronyensis]